MICPNCGEVMNKAMFMKCHICPNEDCDTVIEFTAHEIQSAEIWRFKRNERIRQLVRKDLIDGKICGKWKKTGK